MHDEAMPKRNDRYLAQQKLSNDRFRRVIRCFAAGLTPSEARSTSESDKRVNVSTNAIYEIYDLLRRRLFEIRYFPDPDEAVPRLWSIDEGPEVPTGSRSRTAVLRALYLLSRRRGVGRETMKYHLGELLYRVTNMRQTELELVHDIEKIIKITGKLNKPPRNIEKWYEIQTLYFYTRMLNRVRTMPILDRHRDSRREIIEVTENQINSCLAKKGEMITEPEPDQNG